MALYEEISQNLKQAMKAKDTVKLAVLRMIKSKIMTVNARGDLPDEDIIKIIRTYARNLDDAYTQSKENGRLEAAAELEQERLIVKTYLPEQCSPAKTKELVAQAIEETGATSRKEMGLVMKAVMGQRSDLDGKLVKQLVESSLP